MKRLFLVGTPRSGTTLLQSLLAAHPQLVSFPESHFFPALLPERRWARTLGLASRRARARLAAFLEEVGRPERMRELPLRTRSARGLTAFFTATLDALAEERGARAWLEKTPRHVQYLDLIERYVPGARFVHLVREGPAVVASLYDVTRRYPEPWRGPWELARCGQRWLDDLRETRARRGRPEHLVVRYEDLARDPEAELERLLRWAGLPYESAMLSEYAQAARDLVLDAEPWKRDVQGRIERERASKFTTRLDPEQQALVSGLLAEHSVDRPGDAPPPLVAVHAPVAPTNPYQGLLAAHLTALGSEVVMRGTGGWWRAPTPRRRWPDVVHLHWLHPFFAHRIPWVAALRLLRFGLRLLWLRGHGVRVLWTVHNLEDHEQRNPWLNRLAVRGVGRLASALILHGASARRAAAERLPPSKLHVIPFGSYAGVCPQRGSREQARAELGLPASARVILFFGFVRPYKGIEELLESYRSLAAASPELRLVIAGHAPDPRFAEELRARSRELPGVQLVLERLPEDRIPLHMHAADAVVFPFRRLLHTSSVLLALAFGKPVIAPRLPAVLDYLTGDQPFLYDPDDPGALGEALARLRAAEPAVLDAAGQTSARLSRALDWAEAARATLALYGRPPRR